MSRKRNWRPEDGYRPAKDSTFFLDIEPNENEREKKYNEKVSKYLKSLGMLEEYTEVLFQRVYSRILSENKKQFLAEALTSYDVEDVYATSRLAHLGQKRRDGSQYFSHPKEVANIVRRYYPSDTRAYLVALLHDTIEDTESVGNLSVKELKSMIDASIGDPSESEAIIGAVTALTHDKNQPYSEYVEGLASNPLALKVKISDMMHNLSDAPSERQKKKYEDAIIALSDKHRGSVPGISQKQIKDLVKMTEQTNGNKKVTALTERKLRETVREVLELKFLIAEQNENTSIETVGDLKKLLSQATKGKLKYQAKGSVPGAIADALVDEIAGKIPGFAAAKSLFSALKGTYSLPDTARTGTALDILDVDDDISKIVDDPIENAFLKSVAEKIEGMSDDKPLVDLDMTELLSKYISKEFNNRTVAGFE